MSSFMKNPWFIPVATLVVGAAGGYISGKNTVVGSAPVAEESTQRSRSSTRTTGSASDETAKKSRAGTSTDEIARMPGNSTRVQALIDFYSGLTPEQLAEEAGKLDGLPMGERMLASFLLFGRWAEVDPTAAMAFSNTMGMAGGFVRPTILQSWASVDPANAAKYYAANPREFAMMDMMGGGRGPMGGQGASSIIATEWARQDPAAALAWASSLATGKTEAMNAVVGEVAKTDPRKAADMLAKMSPEERAGSYRSVASRYGALDFVEAQTWIRTLPADEQASALASAVGGLSNTDPFAAAAQVAKMEAGDAKDNLIEDVVGDLARRDPQAAMDFLKEQTSEEAQRDSMRQLMPALTAKNPIAALAFVNSYQPGPVRDSAAQAYVWSNNKGSPAEMIQVAESITDEGDRDRTVGIAAMRWMREDAPAAKAYVEASTSLSDEAKKRITEGRSMWGGGGNGRGPRGGN
jgi:hypothetical protein